MQAIVYKSTGSWYIVKDTMGNTHKARIKGIFKIDDDITSTNPIAVGDIVDINIESEVENTAIITHIHNRKNYINRQSPRVKHQHHIVAANIDQSILMATLREPKTSQGFIDRFLVACEMYHVPAIIIFNKTDLYREKEQVLLEKYSRMYTEIGYRVVAISCKSPQSYSQVNELLKDKITVLSGHSGVGKSTFINAIIPASTLRTTEVSGWSGKGMHTTTFAEMFDLPTGGQLIDTPGLREFGLVLLPRQELSHYFPEMKNLVQQCHYNNCLHINEPGCAVKDAVVAGNINEDRYVSYYNILSSIEDKNY